MTERKPYLRYSRDVLQGSLDPLPNMYMTEDPMLPTSVTGQAARVAILLPVFTKRIEMGRRQAQTPSSCGLGRDVHNLGS